MTKEIRETTVLFDDDEVDELWGDFLAKIEMKAVRHFIDNEGMSVGDAAKRIKTYPPTFLAYLDNTLTVVKIKVDCEIDMTQRRECQCGN